MISKKTFEAVLSLVLFFLMIKANAQTTYQYPFQNPHLNIEKRIDNIISLLTVDEKISCLSTNPSVPRLGIKGSGHIDGLHGVALGGPGGWGRRKLVTTTTFLNLTVLLRHGIRH
jgi:beta-glucosidase